jgi:transposase-like protein
MNKEDFSIFEFFSKYPTEESAKNYFEKTRWNDNMCCPYCSSNRISNCTNPMPYRCMDCRKHFSVRTGTILAESKLPLQKWLLAMYILTASKKGVSSIQLSKHLGCTQKTAWFLAHRIRETWQRDIDKLDGTIEVDEAYFGGKEKNKHNKDKLKAGRGAVGKIAVVGMMQRNGQVRAKVVEQTNHSTLRSEILKNVKVGSNLYTDQYKAYNGLKLYNHKKVKHSVGEYVKGVVHTNSIESFWALLKRGYYGIYHYMSKKHFQKYVNEFVRRFNGKEISIQDQMTNIILDGIGIRLTYGKLKNA